MPAPAPPPFYCCGDLPTPRPANTLAVSCFAPPRPAHAVGTSCRPRVLTPLTPLANHLTSLTSFDRPASLPRGQAALGLRRRHSCCRRSPRKHAHPLPAAAPRSSHAQLPLPSGEPRQKMPPEGRMRLPPPPCRAPISTLLHTWQRALSTCNPYAYFAVFVLQPARRQQHVCWFYPRSFHGAQGARVAGVAALELPHPSSQCGVWRRGSQRSSGCLLGATGT